VRSASPDADGRLTPVAHSAAQLRIVKAAHELFGQHGVSGTSLQMIADAIGVTKAAVYHQFKSKDDAVLAVTATELGLERVVDIAVERRHIASGLQLDPVVVRVLADHEPFVRFVERLYRVLLGEGTGVDDRVNAAIMSGALSAAVMHPLVEDIDDETLKSRVLAVTRRILDLPD
jgi:AcrR family transcriptional regulator